MKTMTRTLALVLAIALAFSLTTAFAASFDDYEDAADAAASDYAEAIDFCVAIGVINGMSETQLGLDGTLTRAQASKIVAYCVLGEKAAEALAASDTKFTDTVGHWAQKYVAYCASENIINGMNDTTFAPEGTLTGYQFAKMLLSALGYGIESRLIDGTTYEVNNYTGEYWATKVSADGNRLGLFENLDDVDLNGEISRAEAMQMAFNAYNMSFNGPNGTKTVSVTTEVQKTNADGSPMYDENGAPVTEEVTETTTVNVDNGYVKDFSDGFFYTTKDYHRSSDDITDVYGRPAHYWVNKAGKAVTDTYRDEPVLTFVYSEFNEKTGDYTPCPVGVVNFLIDQKDMKSYIKSDGTPKGDYKFFGDYDSEDVNLGILAKSEVWFATAGYEIEIYVTDVDGVDFVSAYIIPYYLMKIDEVDQNAKAKEDEDWTDKATLVTWMEDVMVGMDAKLGPVVGRIGFGGSDEITVYDKYDSAESNCKFVTENIADFEKDQYVIVSFDGLVDGEGDPVDDYLTVNIKPAESIEGAVTAINDEKAYIKVDGTQYMTDIYVQDCIGYADGVKVKDEATYYLNNGYIVGFSDPKADKADNFIYIKDAEVRCDSSNFSNSVYIKLDAVFTNGEQKVIEIPVTKSKGTYALPGSEDHPSTEAKYYYVFDGTKYAFDDQVLGATTAVRLDELDGIVPFEEGWYGYIQNDEGTYKIYNPKTDDGQYVINGVTFKDGSATVADGSGANLAAKATANTVATFIDDTNNVTTVKGYKNFNTNDTQETGTNNVLVVYNMDGSKIVDIDRIFVIDAELETTTDYVYCIDFDGEDENGEVYNFFEDGSHVTYVKGEANSVTMQDGYIYTLEIDDGEFTAATPTDDKFVFEAIVKSVSGGYITVIPTDTITGSVDNYIAQFKGTAIDLVDTEMFYVVDDSSVYDITAGDYSISDGASFKAKQVVTLVAEENDNDEFEIIDAYVVSNDYTDYFAD